MAEITDFPDSMQRQWRVHEADIRALYWRVGGNPAELEYVCEQMKQAFLAHGKTDFEIRAATAQEAHLQLNAWVHKQVGGLLVELLKREIELYRLRGNAPKSPG